MWNKLKFSRLDFFIFYNQKYKKDINFQGSFSFHLDKNRIIELPSTKGKQERKQAALRICNRKALGDLTSSVLMTRYGKPSILRPGDEEKRVGSNQGAFTSRYKRTNFSARLLQHAKVP